MKTVVLFSLCLLVNGSLDDVVSGCSSKCSITFDKDLECFNRTLVAFEQLLFGNMRNYIYTQLNVARSSVNHVPPTKDQMVSQTLTGMNAAEPEGIEDEGDVFSPEQARPIVEALVDNVLNAPKSISDNYQEVACPLGCETSETPFEWMFFVSLAGNFLLLFLGLLAMYIANRKDELYSKQLIERDRLCNEQADVKNGSIKRE